jgi:integrase
VPHEEAQRTLAAMAEADRLVYALAFYTGMRIGEIFALDWLAVDLTAGTIRVVESKTEAGRRRRPILEPLLPLLNACYL